MADNSPLFMCNIDPKSFHVHLESNMNVLYVYTKLIFKVSIFAYLLTGSCLFYPIINPCNYLGRYLYPFPEYLSKFGS
jgi:hypothetical protein